jgi:hypothetical protein
MSSLGAYWPVVKTLIECKAASVLDVGAGTGRLGQAIRDYVEVLCWGGHPADRNTWSMFLEGIEVERGYRTPCWQVYDSMIVGDLWDVMAKAEHADFVVCLDVLEHVEPHRQQPLIDLLLSKARRGVVIASPDGWEEQGAGFGNEHERHRSAVSHETFSGRDVSAIWSGDGSIVVVLEKDGSLPVSEVGDLAMHRLWPVDLE